MTWTDNLKVCHGCDRRKCATPQTCICKESGKPYVAEHAKKHDCPLRKFGSPGIGGIVVAVASKPCGCAKRRDALNQIVPGLGTCIQKVLENTGVAAIAKRIIASIA